MNDATLNALFGASFAIFVVAAFLFARYRIIHRDRLFTFFAAAFGCFAAGFLMRVVAGIEEQSGLVFVPRLIGFLLIITAIFDKNRRARGR